MRWGQQKIVFETWNPAQNTIHAILTLWIFQFFFNFFLIFFTDEAHLGWLQNDNHWNSSGFSRLTYKTNQTYQKTSKNSEICQNVSYWARNGGGDIWVLLCSQRGGDTKKFFEKAIVFGVFHRSCQNAKNYQLFEKIFRVPPPLRTQ